MVFSDAKLWLSQETKCGDGAGTVFAPFSNGNLLFFWGSKIRASAFCLSPLALDLRAQFCCCAVERFVKNWNMCPCFSTDSVTGGKSENMKMMLENHEEETENKQL